MNSKWILVTFLGITSLLLGACSAVKPKTAIPLASKQNQITLGDASAIRFQLPSDKWLLQTEDGIPTLISPEGNRIVFLNESTDEIPVEARSALVLDSYSEASAAVRTDWVKANTAVISINKQLGALPLPNIMWVANKDGKELAMMHFYKQGQIYTIRVEGAQHTAREDLSALITGAAVN